MSEENKTTPCCEGISCEIEETDEGFVFRVKGDDREKTRQLKLRMQACCTDSEKCC